MKLGHLAGRAVVIRNERALDVERASGGRFASDPQLLYTEWDALRAWEASADFSAAVPFSQDDLDCPAPRPRQVFAIGLNYSDHAAESGAPIPKDLVVFTKFPSSFGAPNGDVAVVSDRLDYETELVVVVAKGGHRLAAGTGWDHVAGLAVGQDYSDRALQFVAQPPQFSLAKSRPGFSPFGPVLVTADEFADPNALTIGASLSRDGETTALQQGTTADLIFPVATIIERLSALVTLYPGDVIFTGTPAGVGIGKNLFLRPGDVVKSSIDGIGSIRNRFVVDHVS